MSWNVFHERSGNSDVSDFKKAARMAKKGLEIMCEIAADMADEYDGFGEREQDGGNDDDWYGERRGSRRGRR